MSSAKGQVFALGVQVNSTSVRLSIAANKSIADGTVDHLERVWMMLKGVPDTNAGARVTDEGGSCGEESDHTKAFGLGL